MGGAIPFTAIVDFVKIYGIRDFESFHYYIREIESVFMEEKKDGKT